MSTKILAFPTIFLFLLATVPAAQAQERDAAPKPAKNLSAPFNIVDWDLGSAEAIRYGQVSAVRRAGGDFLAIYFLSNEVRSGRKVGTKPAAFNGEYFLISNFDAPPPNSLGGSFGAFQGPPSAAQAEIAKGADGWNALVLTGTKEAEGYCGAWIQLIETNGDPLTREFLNGETFSHLVFWVRGDAASGADVKIADAAWLPRDDSQLVGPISSFVPAKKITPEWQLASIPLESLPGGLDRRTLAVLAIELRSPGAHRIEVKGLALARKGAGLTQAPPKPRPISRATWVWNTEEILASRAERNFLLAHLAEQKMDLVYLNLPYRFGGFVIDDAGLGELVALLGQKGIRTEVLFGDKELALPENHAFVRKAVQDIIAYNSRVAVPARFSGIHLDIEPYLLHGFNGRKRAEIVDGYLKILSESARLTQAAKMSFGVDVPPWFDLFNEYDGQIVTATLSGKTKPVYEHILDICDQVTLMDYRTSPSGLNGILALGVGELAYAASQGKKVYIGLETGPIDDERIFTFRGAPSGDPFVFQNAPYFVCVTGRGEDLSVSVLEAADVAEFRKRLQGVGPGGGIELWWPVYSAPFVPGSSISFAALGSEPLRQAADLTTAEFSVYPSFAGIAVHDYISHRRMGASKK